MVQIQVQNRLARVPQLRQYTRLCGYAGEVAAGHTRRRLLGGVIGLAPVLAGCASGPAPAESGPLGSAAFPVTIDTANGPVTIERKPERMVAYGIRFLDLLHALGVSVVAFNDGGGDLSTTIENFPWVEKIWSGEADASLFTKELKVNVERLATYQPDLVLSGDVDGELFSQISTFADVLALKWTTQNLLTEQLTVVARATGTSDRLPGVLADMDATTAELKGKLPGLQGKTGTLVGAWRDGKLAVTPSPWLETIGLRRLPLVGEKPYVEISSENLEQIDADVVLLGGTPEGLKKLKADPRFARLPASQQGAVIEQQSVYTASTRDAPAARQWLADNIGPRLAATPLNRR